MRFFFSTFKANDDFEYADIRPQSIGESFGGQRSVAVKKKLPGNMDLRQKFDFRVLKVSSHYR